MAENFQHSQRVFRLVAPQITTFLHRKRFPLVDICLMQQAPLILRER
jgi:hypothetical protein